MRKTFCVIAIVLLSAYLVMGRAHWFSEHERDFDVGSNRLYSDSLSFSDTDTITWKVPLDQLLVRRGMGRIEAQIEARDSSTLERQAINEILISSNIGLRVTARMEDGREAERLLQDWINRSDQPFSRLLDLSEWNAANITDYPVANVWYSLYEEMIVELEATTPNARLRDLVFELEFVSDHNVSNYLFIGYTRLIRDIYAGTALVLILGLAYLAWRPTRAVPTDASVPSDSDEAPARE